ncbi:hypothetical protein L3Q82_023610, partial [Scortum barcoo]
CARQVTLNIYFEALEWENSLPPLVFNRSRAVALRGAGRPPSARGDPARFWQGSAAVPRRGKETVYCRLVVCDRLLRLTAQPSEKSVLALAAEVQRCQQKYQDSSVRYQTSTLLFCNEMSRMFRFDTNSLSLAAQLFNDAAVISHLDVMPVRVLSEGAGPGAQVPTHLTEIPISLISTDTDCSNHTVKGKVVHKGPLVSLQADNFILKTVIQVLLRGSTEIDSGDINLIGAVVCPTLIQFVQTDENTDMFESKIRKEYMFWFEEQSSANASINVVLLGALAKDFNGAVNQGDVVVASGFTVGKSPTVQKDKLHPCNLLLSGGDACVYVSRLPPSPPNPRSSPAAKRSAALSAEVSRTAKAPKYTYVGLGDLKAGSVVNVYGVVVFFKQPFKSRGTDFCSSLKITDQSNQKIGCTIFREKLEDHPKIFQNGDIVRMHRVKTQSFNDSITLVNTYGFSVVTFDGTLGADVEPRTSSRSFHFDQEDRRIVEELRSWAASHALLPPVSTIPLSTVQPKAYFDLTCQLLAKAPVDTTCTLLRVWDGTRCPHTLLKVIVEPNVTEGPSSFSAEKESLIANVLVYDNHVESARQLKPGNFLRIYNLRAIPGSSKVPGLTSSQSVEVDHLAFHLHGGTAYGRGIRVLPENSPDVQELRRVIEAFTEEDELNDSSLLEVWSTPPESLDGETVECSTERSCGHDVQPVTLSELKRSDQGGVHHVRVQLRSYEPRRLHQALKLYCSKCTSMQDVPDDELVAGLFSEASWDSGPCSVPPWMLSGRVDVPGDPPGSPNRALNVHLSTQLVSEGKSKELIFLMGSTLEETCRLTAGYQNIVPIRSSGGRLALLDLSAPFLFRGRKRYYGCRRCSEAAVREPSAEGVELIDEKMVAEALGVQLLRFVLLMKLELQDATDTLDAFLWRDAESFFGVSAEDVSANQEAQQSVRQAMDSLCPPGGSTGVFASPQVSVRGSTCVCRRIERRMTRDRTKPAIRSAAPESPNPFPPRGPTPSPPEPPA